jgi:hypothetical protein
MFAIENKRHDMADGDLNNQIARMSKSHAVFEGDYRG